MPTPTPSSFDRRHTRLPRGRHGLPRSFVVRSQRERLVTAIAEVVSERGYAAMTVADVVERAGVSRRTFYEHFDDKEDSLLQAYDMAFEQLMEGLTAAYSREEQWRDGMRAGIGAFLFGLSAEPALARMCMVEVLTAGPRALARRDRALRELLNLYERGLPMAKYSVSKVVTETVVAGIYEVVYTRILHDDAASLPQLRAQLMYWAMVPCFGHDEARRELGELRDWRSDADAPQPADGEAATDAADQRPDGGEASADGAIPPAAAGTVRDEEADEPPMATAGPPA